MNDPTRLSYSEVFSVTNFTSIITTITEHWLVKGSLAIILGVNNWFFGTNQELVRVVYVLLVLDTITGFLKAHKNHCVSSSGFFRFALKMFVYMILLMVGSALDKISPITGLVSGLSIVAAFLSLTEALSVLENTADLGFAVPTKLIKLLKFAQTVSGNSAEEAAGKRGKSDGN